MLGGRVECDTSVGSVSRDITYMNDAGRAGALEVRENR